MSEQQIVINDMLVNYYITGRPDSTAKTVIFLHGWRADGKVWIPVIRAMESVGYSFYSLDLPGFGKSQISSGDFSLFDYCDVVFKFVKKLELEDLILVGHSFGGRIAIKLAGTRPDLIRKLILVDSAGIRVEPKLKVVKKLFAKILRPFFLFSFTQPLRRRLYQMIGAEDYIVTPELNKTFLNVISEDLTDYLEKIGIPTLLVWGENDKDTPLAVGKRMHSLIPNSKFKILSNAGHYSFLDQPENFIKELVAFIKS